MTERWGAFLDEADALVENVEKGSAAVDALCAMEMDALIWGMDPLARLCRALGEAYEARAAGENTDKALVVLRQALRALRDADSSGPRLDPTPIEEVLKGLAPRRTQAQPPPPPPPPSDGPSDSVWKPTVDEDMIDPFLEECQDRLEGLSERLIELERDPGSDELVRAIFRDLHTLKGSSGFVGLRKMTRLSHAAEDLIGLVRDGHRAADRGVIDALLASLDVLQAILHRATDRASIDIDIEPAIHALRATQTGSKAPTASRPASAVARMEAPTSRVQQTLRIEFEKLDELMNLVGELVLAKGRVGVGLSDLSGLGRELEAQRRGARGKQSSRGLVRLQDLATELGRLQRAFDALHGDLNGAQQALEFVSGQLRDQVMKLRMVPVGRSWSKYHRTVRQISGQLGKEVRLELQGEDTELDKVLVEHLDDPLMHIVRNAIDHGIETPDIREAQGKPAEGTLRLEAMHRGNQIVIRVVDDGQGIDASKVRAKAIDKGLLDKGTAAELEPAQIYDLIFHAGFSTAEKVSDLSGRGVGMDVVREALTRLKGTVHVDSRPGEGTSFELRLPLTLAIVQVLLIRCAGQTFALPIDLVRRTVSVLPDSLRIAGQQETFLDGGVDTPVLRLNHLLGLPRAASDELAEHPVVLVEVGNQTIGLMCDGFLGRQEIVVKSLGSLLTRVQGAAGATLLGDQCVIILDVPALVAMALADPSLTRAPESFLPPSQEEQESPRKLRVLIAEDADVIRETIRRTLTKAGFEVVVARDGVEALEHARAAQFDLVSTDVVMPRMDGYELTRRLRAMDGYRDIPILMVTSKAERIDRIRGFDAGVDAYLTKPADAAELLRAVQRHVNLGDAPKT